MENSTQPTIPMRFVDGAFLIDNSGIELLKCPRLFQQQFLQRRALAAAKAGRNFGSTLHQGWATRYERCGNQAVKSEDAVAIYDSMQKWLEAHPQPETDFRNFDHACKMMEVYNDIYRSEPWKIIKGVNGKPVVEASFALPFGSVQDIPIIYTGKIDLGIEDNGGVWSHDHKTAFQFGEAWELQMAVDGGQTGYVWALRQILGGAKVNGYIIDGVRVRRPRKQDEYTGIAPIDATDFKRLPFYVSDDAIEEWREDTLHLISDIFWHHDRQYFPRHRWNCTTKFGKCDFYDVCTLPRKSRAQVLAGSDFIDNDWTPLKDVEDAKKFGVTINTKE